MSKRLNLNHMCKPANCPSAIRFFDSAEITFRRPEKLLTVKLILWILCRHTITAPKTPLALLASRPAPSSGSVPRLLTIRWLAYDFRSFDQREEPADDDNEQTYDRPRRILPIIKGGGTLFRVVPKFEDLKYQNCFILLPHFKPFLFSWLLSIFRTSNFTFFNSSKSTDE